MHGLMTDIAYNLTSLVDVFAPGRFGPVLLAAKSSVDDVLSPYVFVFYASFIIAFIFTPIMQTVASYYGIIDKPDGDRKMHRKPVAYLGGVAVFLGWMAGLALSQFLNLHRTDVGLPRHLVINISIVAGAAIIMLLGLWDDVKSISAKVKISGQLFAAILLLLNDVGTRCAEGLIRPVDIRIMNLFFAGTPGQFFPEWFIVGTSCLLVIALVVGCCNATNLMDGLDGLCGGVTAIMAAGYLFLAVHLATTGGAMDSNADALRVVLGMALLGAVLGFIPYNFNPASIFMGDTGSMFLGFSCATMIILLAEANPKWFLAAMVMFALPWLDTSLAFARRYVNKRPLFSPDRYHIHHQFVARGLSVRRTVVLIYLMAIGFVVLGATIAFMRTRYSVAFYLVIFGSIIVAAYKMGMVHEKTKIVTPRGMDNAVSKEISTQSFDPSQVIEVRDPTPIPSSQPRPVA